MTSLSFAAEAFVQPILDRIARESGIPDLVEILSRKLAPRDLQSLLLEVARIRAEARTPSDVLRQYREDRFVRPSRADPRVLLAIDRHAFQSVPRDFEAIEIGPLAPLGACAAIATVSQHKIVSTMRTGEVASDASNVLALECAVRRAKDPSGAPVRLCTSARMTRAQMPGRPEHSAHFRLFVTVAAGRDARDRTFQETALSDAIGSQLRLLHALAHDGFAFGGMDVSISADALHRTAAERARDALRSAFPEVPIEIEPSRIAASRYYQGLAFRVNVHSRDGASFPLGDGGLTDWVARLTGSRKERTMIGAIATELLATVFAPAKPADVGDANDR